MIEIIKAVALLCQVSGDNDFSYIRQEQVRCHQWYLECLDGKKTPRDEALKVCVKERK